MLNDTIQLMKAQCIERFLLIGRSTNSTLNLFDLYSRHNLPSLSSKYFFNADSSILSYHTSITHFAQSQDCSLNQIVRV